jgi:hypothetical protein
MNLSYFKYTIVSNSIAKEHDNWYSCGDSPITNSDPDGMQVSVPFNDLNFD